MLKVSELKDWKDGINKIVQGDCLELMKKMPDKCIDLVVTSPPYNFDAGSGIGSKYKELNDNRDDYFEWSVQVINELLRVSKLVTYNIQMLAGNKIELMQLLGNFSKQIREIIIWDKKTSEPAINEKILN